MTRELLQQALEALEHITKDSSGKTGVEILTDIHEAVETIRDHLAKPQGEPVAWINPAGTYAEASTSSTVYGSTTIPLYIHPAHTEADIDAAQQAQPAHTEAEVQELLNYFKVYMCYSAEGLVRRILNVPAPEDK